MSWIRAVERLRTQRRPGVLVTVSAVRGHAPREAGAKMVVGADDEWDTIGGGNLEATAVERARAMIVGAVTVPESLHLRLTDKADATHGRQCCGGEVELLLEPLCVVPAVAIFGVGHVGLELARILSRHDLELHLIDSRPAHLEPARLRALDDAIARVHLHHAPVPEMVISQVPDGAHVLIMTHDHAEDAALCDMALRSPRLGPIGLIGSSAKWSRFTKMLLSEGHPPETLTRITTPIGLADVVGKSPSVIAVSVAADLVRSFSREITREESRP